jgi:hypothetical protein
MHEFTPRLLLPCSKSSFNSVHNSSPLLCNTNNTQTRTCHKDNTKPEGKQRYTQPPQLKMSAPPIHHLGTLAILPPELHEIIYENIPRDVRTTYASSRRTINPILLLHVNSALRSSAISTIKCTRIVKLYTPTFLCHLTSRHPVPPRRIALWPWSNVNKNK